MPGPGRAGFGMKNTVENPMKVLGKIIGYIFRYYKFRYILVLAMIVVTVLATVRGTMFMRTLIDDYILPMIGQENPDFGPLLAAITKIAIIEIRLTTAKS